jgi:hypothetical protein
MAQRRKTNVRSFVQSSPSIVELLPYAPHLFGRGVQRVGEHEAAHGEQDDDSDQRRRHVITHTTKRKTEYMATHAHTPSSVPMTMPLNALLTG